MYSCIVCALNDTYIDNMHVTLHIELLFFSCVYTREYCIRAVFTLTLIIYILLTYTIYYTVYTIH